MYVFRRYVNSLVSFSSSYNRTESDLLKCEMMVNDDDDDGADDYDGHDDGHEDGHDDDDDGNNHILLIRQMLAFQTQHLDC